MEELNHFIEQFENLKSGQFILRLAQFVLWSAFILILAWLAAKGINRSIKNNNLRYRIRKSIRIGSYVLVLLIALVMFTGNAQYFSISIGLVSAGVAFALQEVILSIAGWVAIITTHTYNPGDRIEINNVKGDVIDISITRTTLMEIGEWVSSDNYTGRIVQVSNSAVFRGPVRNYSTDFPFVWDEIRLPVRYGSDLELATSIITENAHKLLDDYALFASNHWDNMKKKYLIEPANVEPTLSLVLTDNWIEFTLRFVVDYKRRRITKHTLYSNIHEAVEGTGGKVALASATYEIVGVPEIRIAKDPPIQDV